MRPHEMTAVEALAAMERGQLNSETLVRSCVERIAAIEDRVRAWTYLDADGALTRAREADRVRNTGAPLGPLHGIPIGIKDIFDTADMPTENGTVLDAGRRPSRDAAAVSLVRAAGGVIVGKTVTTELAVYAPGKTTNPHDERRTPGGSSSGSAAAVAAGMVPLALGTQTNGSLIRPASYCGVFGFKPSHGAIDRCGVLEQSPTLDHVGMFARSVDDLSLLSRAVFDQGLGDAGLPRSLPSSDVRGATLDPPRVAFVKTPVWDLAADGTKAAFEHLRDNLRDHVRDVELSPLFASALEWHRIIMESDLAARFESYYARGKDRLSEALREMIERGQRHATADYQRAQEGRVALQRELAGIFAQFDAIVTPATTDAAPMGLASTGSPAFCTIWTLCGTPSITLPLLTGEGGMPLGAQLIGAYDNDARLLQVADWLAQKRPQRLP